MDDVCVPHSNFWRNNISEIPEFIGEMQTLKKLNIGGNPYSTLPSSLSGLKDLRSLFVPPTHIWYIAITLNIIY